MTMPWGSTEEPEVTKVGHSSIPVHVVSTDAKPTRPVAAEFGQWTTYNMILANGAVQILPRMLRRHRALIYVLPSASAQSTLDGICLGSRNIITSLANPNTSPTPGPGNGGFLPIGATARWESQQELWAIPVWYNADAVYITVCDMIYASDTTAYERTHE